MFKNYLTTAWRNIRKNKTYSFINIAGLAAGLVCCMLILLYTKDEVSFDRFHLKIKHIYQLTCNRLSKEGENKHFAIAAMVQGPAFRQAIPEINSFVRVNRQPMLVKKDKETFNESATWTDENFFSVFSFPLLKGNSKNVLTDMHSLVLTDESAKKYFGATDAVGKSLELEIDGKFESFVVTGIAKIAPQNSSIQFSLLLPFKYLEKKHPDNGWMWVSYPTYFTINPHADIPAVAVKMNKIFHAAASEELAINKLSGYNDEFVWGLQQFQKMHMQTQFEGNPGASNPIYSYILSGIAIFILLIACINFINLTIAQSLKRSKEIGLRKVIGALRKQLIKQFLGESFFICFVAFAIALLLTQIVLPFFNELSNKKLSLGYLFDFKLVLAFISLFLLTGFAAGFYPAMILSGFNPVNSLYGRARLTGKNYFGKSLVILQFSFATFLIICTVFVYLQFNYLTNTEIGYNDNNLLELTIDNAVMNRSLTDRCKTSFANTPGVEMVATQNVGKFGGKTMADGKELTAVYTHVDENFLPVMEIPVIDGRNFSKDNPSDLSNAVLVNETFLKEMGWKNAAGKTIDYMDFPGWGGRKITIAGVFKDYHFESLKEKIKPQVLTLESTLPMGKFLLRIKSAHISSTLQSIEKAYQKIVPFHPFQYQFKNDLNYNNYEAESKVKQIISFGALFTILISCVGLFGLTFLSIQHRTKETGIRKVLGSGIFKICISLSKQFLLLVLIGFLIAAPIAWVAVNNWLQDFAYKINISGWIFFLTGMFTMTIALLTVSYHSVRAAVMNPVDALRKE